MMPMMMGADIEVPASAVIRSVGVGDAYAEVGLEVDDESTLFMSEGKGMGGGVGSCVRRESGGWVGMAVDVDV